MAWDALLEMGMGVFSSSKSKSEYRMEKSFQSDSKRHNEEYENLCMHDTRI